MFHREWKFRENIVDDDKMDTVTYTMKNKFIFRPDLSKGLTGDEIVTVPNLVMFSAINSVKRYRFEMMPFVTKAMSLIFNEPKSVFLTSSVMDLLFNGIAFNCDANDFAAKAVCESIKSEGDGQGVRVINETYLSISMLGHVSLSLRNQPNDSMI